MKTYDKIGRESGTFPETKDEQNWVTNVTPAGIELVCSDCGNRLIIRLPLERQKQMRIELAKAIWNLP